MRAFPIVILVLVAVAVVRLGLRRRGRASGASLGWPRALPRLGDRRLLGDTGLVAGREIRERLRGRLFRVVTVILFAVVAAAVIIPTIHTGTTRTSKVGVVGASARVKGELRALARSTGVAIRLVDEPDLARARAALGAGGLELVVDGTKRLLVRTPVAASGTSAEARYVRDVSVVLGAQRTYARAGLTAAQAAIVARAKPLPVHSLRPGKRPTTTSEATALLGIIFIFVVLSQYLTWTLMGVMEEKASRVVEVLLATVRPLELLAGKVIGIGAVVLAQAAALVVFALVLGEAVGSSLVHGTAPLVAAATLLWLVLGYAFYSWVYAAAGALAERQDQVQSMALPLGVPLIVGYLVALIGVSTGDPSTLVKVFAYLPPTAPFAMTALVGFGDATWWQFLLSVAESLACTVVVARFAARVYRSAVLQTGGRVRLRQLLPAATR